MKKIFVTLFVSAISIFLNTNTIIAAVNVNDCVSSGVVEIVENQVVDGSPIGKWPEEVKYGSNSLKAEALSGGTNFCNSTRTIPNSDFLAHNRVMGQVFEIPKTDGNQKLDAIFIAAKVFNDKNPMQFHLRLVELGETPYLDSYEAGKNLLEGDPEIAIETPSQDQNSGQIIRFDFTENHRVLLKAGFWYSFEMVADPENKPTSMFVWLRGILTNKDASSYPVFRVPFSEDTKDTDSRSIAIKDRQAFMGVKTSPAN